MVSQFPQLTQAAECQRLLDETAAARWRGGRNPDQLGGVGVDVDGEVADGVELLIEPGLVFAPLCFLVFVVVVEVSAAAPVLAEGVRGSVVVVSDCDPLDRDMELEVPGVCDAPGIVAPGDVVPEVEEPGGVPPPEAAPALPPVVCARAGTVTAIAKAAPKIKVLRIIISVILLLWSAQRITDDLAPKEID
jgi:hypothetical protein